MKKVLILGCAGSGKSTFSKLLGQHKNLPVIHLDSLYWKPGWIESTEDEWDKIIDELIHEEEYVLDGNYTRTLKARLEEADTVFYFDYPRYLCLFRVIKRRILNHGKTRVDMAKGCKEKLDSEFIKWIWNFNTVNRPKIIKLLDQVKGQKQVYIFNNPKELECYMKTL